jgi:DNA modification methylase
MIYEMHLGDCLQSMRAMPDNSVDSIVTDPPYGLSFMGKRWDYDVPGVGVWAECLRVLKPGGHLLAFAGTRTQHRMAVRIEDAGFEIRDLIAWVYGSGFPKSLDVSKAIDKAAGAEREVVGENPTFRPNTRGNGTDGFRDRRTEASITAPATEAARQWQGWGTALKPALETVTFASKPYTEQQERDIIQSNLIRLEAQLWLLSFASAAERNSTSNQSEYGAACAIAQWSADEITSTRAALCAQMDTSPFELATNTSLNIVSLWRRTLAESWSDGSTFTTETKSSTTTDLRTFKFSLSQITPESIIKACSLPGGFIANASTAESHFNASLLLLQSIRTLSATERAISLEAQSYQGAGVRPNLDPCIMARKPLIGTVAENVLAHGTGAINVDGCRVGTEGGTAKGSKPHGAGNGIYGAGLHGACEIKQLDAGRWPANLIHDGSDEVVAGFPGDGSAARFFYCAKASKSDRENGNTHPTVKPTDLMRYLCRLVTPPGGVVLDPFMGSGSTGKAAVLEGFRFIGCELSPEYMAIAEARVSAAYNDWMGDDL